MTSDVREAMRAARERLCERMLPTEPAERWGMIDAARVAVQWDGVTKDLYSVIEYGEKALEAQAAGDFEAFSAAHKVMLGAEQSSRLPQTAKRFHKQRQRTSARKPRSKGKQAARQLYDKHHPTDVQDFLSRLKKIGLKPKSKTVSNWLTEFRQKKINSR